MGMKMEVDAEWSADQKHYWEAIIESKMKHTWRVLGNKIGWI